VLSFPADPFTLDLTGTVWKCLCQTAGVRQCISLIALIKSFVEPLPHDLSLPHKSESGVPHLTCTRRGRESSPPHAACLLDDEFARVLYLVYKREEDSHSRICIHIFLTTNQISRTAHQTTYLKATLKFSIIVSGMADHSPVDREPSVSNVWSPSITEQPASHYTTSPKKDWCHSQPMSCKANIAVLVILNFGLLLLLVNISCIIYRARKRRRQFEESVEAYSQKDRDGGSLRR